MRVFQGGGGNEMMGGKGGGDVEVMGKEWEWGLCCSEEKAVVVGGGGGCCREEKGMRGCWFEEKGRGMVIHNNLHNLAILTNNFIYTYRLQLGIRY